jgi:ribosomal protein L11 methylase PrmA
MTTSRTLIDPGSYRDPSGQIYSVEGKIFRTVMPAAAEDFDFTRSHDVFRRLVREQRIIAEEVVAPEVIGAGAEAYRVLEHPRVPVISYPYEWCFSQLKSAALHHLDLHLELLDGGITLSDASAYNLQFQGPTPIFIDALSFRRYIDGEYWLGHRQFCEQFLNPLLLRALFGVPHNAWYRGSLEGISAVHLARLLRARHLLSWNVLTHVLLQGRFQHQTTQKSLAEQRVTERKLPLLGFKQILRGLRKYIHKLKPAESGATLWEDYATHNSYAPIEASAKHQFIAKFAATVTPDLICDIGCNTGDYLAVALESGAKYGIGLDADQGSLDKLFARANKQHLRLLPLYCDFADPTPSQGWAGAERPGILSRAKSDAVLALGLVHHLAIGRNLPLAAVIDALLSIAPQGVIEFVQKADPMTQALLRFRKDIFPDYREDFFENYLRSRATIVQTATVSEHGRKLYWFAKH